MSDTALYSPCLAKRLLMSSAAYGLARKCVSSDDFIAMCNQQLDVPASVFIQLCIGDEVGHNTIIIHAQLTPLRCMPGRHRHVPASKETSC